MSKRIGIGCGIGVILILVVGGMRLLSSSQAAVASVAVPDTAYAVPAGAIFMSPSGNDASSGTQGAPVKTLARAIAAAPSGGTIVVRAGVYRDGSTASVYKPLTIQAYPHEQVWFDGTDLTSGWQAYSASQWSLAWSTPSYCGGHYYDYGFRAQTANGPCAYYDQYNDASNPMSADPQMVFVDGVYVHEVATAAEAVGNNFYYDQAGKRIILGINPSGHTVEATARPSAIVLQGGSGPATIRGIGFRHYASNNYSGNATQASILVGEPNVTLENDAFVENAGAGVGMSDPRSAVIRGTLFWHNGGNGLDGNGHQHGTGVADNPLIENNTLDGNNTERFGSGCNYACQSAGSKLNHMDGFTVRNNIFENNVGTAHGLWCDLACSNGVIVGNVFKNNGGDGVFYEVSNTGIIASNLIVGNGSYGIKMGSANTKVYNNTVINNGVGALVYDDDRSYGIGGWTDVGPDTVNVSFVNNIFSGNKSTAVQSWRTTATSPNTGPNTFYGTYDYNSYFRSGTTPNIADWRDGSSTSYSSVASLNQAKGKEIHGQDITTGTDPFFVDVAAGNYAVRSTSSAYNSGAALPTDVAAALGVAATPVSRGAIKWVAQQTVTSVPTPTPTSAPSTPGTPSLPPATPGTPSPPPASGVLGDVSGDSRVNTADLSVLLTHAGQNYAAADLNHDGTVGAADLAILLARWTW